MGYLIRSIVTVFAAVGFVLPAFPPMPEARSASLPNQIKIAYVPPAGSTYQPIYTMLKKRQVLEKFRDFLSFVRLPTPLTLKVSECGGEANAWYDDETHTVTVCYEYVADIQAQAPKETTAGVMPEDAVIGPFVEVFLHETSHALFDLLEIPILGREEDAADQLATYVMLGLGKDFARRTISGAAWMYAQSAKRATPGKEDFSDVHSLDAQRFYNCLCLAHGAYPNLFPDVVEKGYLPKERAEGCIDEYEQVAYAVHKLLAPYVDRAKGKKARATKWLRSPKGELSDAKAPAEHN